jgi:trigger factor
MADETRTEETPETSQPTEAAAVEGTTAVAEPAAEEEAPPKLQQQVEIRDIGPCKKHIKVSIARENIDSRLNEKFSEMMPEAAVPGYRPGKAPRKLIEKKFYKDVSDQLKAEVLLQSLEQLAEEHSLNPIAQPELDPFKVDLPKEGPFEYEFDIEVAPEFDLPQYKGLKLKRPVREIKPDQVDKAQRQFLGRFGTLVPKDGPAEIEDYLVTDLTFEVSGQELSRVKEITVKVDPQLAFKDGLIKDFGVKMKGVRAGESRTVDVVLSANVSNPALRGKTAKGTFHVMEVKSLRLPELTEHFLAGLGMQTPEQLQDKFRTLLKQQLEYEQRQSAREQVLAQITAAAQWELPRDLLSRQARRSLQRRVLEMRRAGFSEEDIKSRSTLLQQDALANTARALKEHFVLQKVADVEKIEVRDEDVDQEIAMLAAQSEETPRKVRARIERDDLMESLMTEILERKALNLVLESAEYQDVQVGQEEAVGAVEEQAVPGEAPEEEESKEEPAAQA